MPIYQNDCIGDARKEQIVVTYDLQAIARFTITPGTTIKGCCGELSNEQVVFRYKNKKTPSDEGEFSVGEKCAKQLLVRTGQSMPDIFDPFSSPAGSPSSGGGSSITLQNSSPWDQLNKELYQAILLWCSLNNQIPKYSTSKILATIVGNPQQRVPDKDVYEFFKVVATYKKSLASLIQVASNSHKLKKLSFPLLTSMAAQNWIDIP